ncbi:MAG: hypothetical protein HGA57_06215 [Chlorobium limicola]|uniref:Uncharacterized protein n=1 Tax=Chlorobium limicola (strain DSM 245 / NBRC 103803 / 6330) TaxID=290315 RepID=B3EDI1_CHLL2|nr:hypothetical protein [Chlorobium limicola]ACD90606.1 conserved hypothetical protein [Chlorobium limicola DSM 245]NTV20965.1 hypothetical protein [Chlorobium limicola]
MRQVIQLLVLLLVAVGFEGCIRVSTLVSVNPDGSGRLTERVAMNVSYMSMMGSSAKGDEKKKGVSLPDRDALRKSAEAMGEGVTPISVRAFTDGSYEGYEAVYAFRNVSRIQVSGAMSERMGMDSTRMVNSSPSLNDQVRFRFIKGSPATLDIYLPEEQALFTPAKKGDAPVTPPSSEQQKLSLAIIRELFKGTRMTLAVEVQGNIVKTNAECREGSRVILADVDFDQLLLEENQDNTLLNLTGYGRSPEAVGDILNRIRGMRGETKREVSVVFQ